MGIYSKQLKVGKRYYYDFTHKYDRHRSEGGFRTKLEAQAALVKHRQEVKLGKRRRIACPRFSVFAKEFLDTKKHLRSWNRTAIAIDRLVEYFDDVRLNEIASKDIHKYRTKRRGDGVTDSNINRELSCLQTLFNLAIEYEETHFNPVNRKNTSSRNTNGRASWR